MTMVNSSPAVNACSESHAIMCTHAVCMKQLSLNDSSRLLSNQRPYLSPLTTYSLYTSANKNCSKNDLTRQVFSSVYTEEHNLEKCDLKPRSPIRR